MYGLVYYNCVHIQSKRKQTNKQDETANLKVEDSEKIKVNKEIYEVCWRKKNKEKTKMNIYTQIRVYAYKNRIHLNS